MNKSESITALAKALTKFQAEVSNPKNTAINPHFKSKYAPLQDILALVRPVLSKYGLSVVQFPSGNGQDIIISTILMHESGEWLEADPLTLKADKPTAQGAGSAITYGRRYTLSAILGISSEDDNDGNIADKGKKEPEAGTHKAETRDTQGNPPVNFDTEKARRTFFAAMGDVAKETGVDKDYAEKYGKKFVYAAMSVDSLSKLTTEQWASLVKSMDGLKKSTISAITKSLAPKESEVVGQ